MLHSVPCPSGRRLAAAWALLAAALGSAVLLASCRGRHEAAAYDKAIDGLRAVQAEPLRTRVLVLATFHIRQLAKTFKPELLDALVAKLEAFEPSAVCVESLPGARVRELDFRRAAGPLYAEVLDGFAAVHLKLGRQALDLLGTTPEAAAVKVRELLSTARKANDRRLAPEARASLALWMLASYEPSSATLQWSYLSRAEREAQTVIPPDLAAGLDAEAARVNEVPALAARLARSAGLERLDAVDDFEDLDAYAEIMPQLEKDFEGNPLLSAASKAPIYVESEARLQACLQKGNLLPQYEFLNSAAYGEADVDAQWGVFLRTRLASGTDRARLGLWENRNLKIAARVRAVAALHPGGRILVVYGAAHKPFLEAYLGRMADVELVRFEEAGRR